MYEYTDYLGDDYFSFPDAIKSCMFPKDSVFQQTMQETWALAKVAFYWQSCGKWFE